MIGEVERARVPAAEEDAGVVTTSLVLGAEAFMGLEAEWRSLFEASLTQNPFLCWEWISTWAQHFCGDRLHTIVVRRDSHTIAVAPFYLNRYLIGPGVHASALQLLGPKEVHNLFEMREVLTIPGHERGAMDAVLGRALDIPGWDWIELSAQGEHLAVWDETLTQRHLSGLEVHREPAVSIPLMTLESNWEEQRKVMKRNIKESIRHCYNALRRDKHEYFFVADGGSSNPVEAARRLLELHHRRSLVQARQWHRDNFADDSIRAFEVDALSRMHAGGRARFAELAIDGHVVASRACLEAHGALYFYYSGFDPLWWKYSVMTLVVTEAIKDAIARRLSTVNFSPGVDDSKSRWGVSLTPMQTITLVRDRARHRLRFRLLRFRKKIRQPLHRQLDRALSIFRRREEEPVKTSEVDRTSPR
jgi:CelD/BcsL family acetyltransferase involved in cellulose biosynthesis